MIVHHLNLKLDDLNAALERGEAKEYLREFADMLEALHAQRADAGKKMWPVQVAKIRKHPVSEVLLRCPMTRHSFDKPRGYPGDASLLDWIYYHDELESNIENATARVLYHHNVRRTAPSAVRARAKRLATYIDELPNDGSMLALACGHFREAELSQAIQEGRLSRVHLVDQDERSLKKVEERRIVNASLEQANVMKYPRNSNSSQLYDLVYAAGLFDYFSPKMAQRVANRLWSYVAPGGTLCIPNFNDNIPDAAYLECFMDWWLVYRNGQDMRDILSQLPEGEVANSACELKDEENIWYLRATRNTKPVFHPVRFDTEIEPHVTGPLGGSSELKSGEKSDETTI